ncbi:site-specific integrase [Streptomyces sp. A3M-1-3]|uniref:site-specific integrase n=1 Tax=Streptomyces sp. A3M-1-3 TaxID=2962044 RepID=UPI0020B8A062|nr:site-specific integrase [Streptomyces sp. A3M-1-3]MCP3818142.1 site-specific integrase [Streptomyces sp. A3M-1-3]
MDDYLALCTDREHSPNTLRARAFDLKAWLDFLQLLGVDLLAASPEQVDQFAGWLRRPVQPGRLRLADTDDGPAREASTVNRALNSVYMFYEFLARRGVGMGAQLTHRRATSIGDHGGFLAGIRAPGHRTADPVEAGQAAARDSVGYRGTADFGRL